jgi:hypothetical protein
MNTHLVTYQKIGCPGRCKGKASLAVAALAPARTKTLLPPEIIKPVRLKRAGFFRAIENHRREKTGTWGRIQFDSQYM